MAGAEGLGDLARGLDNAPILKAWIAATQTTNLRSLRDRGGPGGEPLAPNRPYTIRRKKHDRVGFDSGQMAAGLVTPLAALGTIGGPKDDEVQVLAGPGATDAKLNVFLKGQTKDVTVRAGKRGEKKRKEARKLVVLGRDFIGIDERDVTAAAEHAMAEVFRQWGFREGR